MVFGDSLRVELDGAAIGVTILNPAVVDTGFFDRRGVPYHRRFPRPVSPDRVAAALIKGVSRDRAEVIVPGWLRLPIALRACAPGAYWRLAGRWAGSPPASAAAGRPSAGTPAEVAQKRKLMVEGGAKVLTSFLRAGDTGEGPSSRAFRSQRPTTVLDIAADAPSRSWETVAAQQGYSSLLAVPLTLLVVAAVASLVVRFRRARGEERQQPLPLPLHLRHGEELTLELVSGTPEQREMFQDAVNRWWRPIMHFFGPPSKPDKDVLLYWGIKTRSNENLQGLRSPSATICHFAPRLFTLSASSLPSRLAGFCARFSGSPPAPPSPMPT
jgi:hypothetical protein